MTDSNRERPLPKPRLSARRAGARVLQRIEAFLRIEAASGLVLMLATIVALTWANSPIAHAYHRICEAPATHFVINDGLMVVFFFVVGVEIRREMHDGALSDFKRAALPTFAALGGMLAPAIIFLILNHGQASQRGWGIPMATDIAFAVGVLTLLGKRVPAGLRVMLLALAVIDDIGAIVIIAVFYSSGVSASGVLLASAGVAIALVLRRFDVRHAAAYLAAGIVMWLGCLRAGVHPTIAGVILGLLAPARAHKTLHRCVAFGIVPLFALANAGVSVDHVQWEATAMKPASLGIVLGLVVGKPLGVLFMSWLALRLRIAAKPDDVTWRGLGIVGLVAGIGFTMAIFITDLAFSGSPLLGAAKIAVLAASVLSGVVTMVAGRFFLEAKT